MRYTMIVTIEADGEEAAISTAMQGGSLMQHIEWMDTRPEFGEGSVRVAICDEPLPDPLIEALARSRTQTNDPSIARLSVRESAPSGAARRRLHLY